MNLVKVQLGEGAETIDEDFGQGRDLGQAFIADGKTGRIGKGAQAGELLRIDRGRHRRRIAMDPERAHGKIPGGSRVARDLSIGQNGQAGAPDFCG